ncbi:MAG TPA: DUF1800 domain-containing protein [Vicinamibacterales bacterium]
MIALVTASLGLLHGAAGSNDGDAAALHVLNRIGFGARAEDVARVRKIGVARYVDEQLHPDRIDDRSVVTRLAGFQTLELNSRTLAEKYEQPLMEARRNQKQSAAGAGNSGAPAAGAAPRDPRMAAEREAANLPLAELSQQKVLRAIYSERQLQEVLTDFWFNHFNVDARKGPERFLLTEYERDVIRPHVLGRFRDLLGATAKSPAMLFYLDNWLSADPNGPHTQTRVQPNFGGLGRRPGASPFPRPPNPQQGQAANGQKKGLNENYGRELMELHTLGVDGGYTQKDVTEVARAFTGWTIENPRRGGGFHFDARLHDDGEKTILGHRIKAGGGIHDGEQVLDLLAGHPSTARFISTKLVQRFVSDTPPPALVERAAAKFSDSGGDLRAVMTLILTSPEFLSPSAYGAKVKTPFEFVVSSVRTTGAEVTDARTLVRQVQQLGMPLYQCQPPTGYKDTADAWVNTGALVNRMNFGLSLASGRLPGLAVRDGLRPDELVSNLSDTTRATIAKASTAPQALALTLGSPEFQRR